MKLRILLSLLTALTAALSPIAAQTSADADEDPRQTPLLQRLSQPGSTVTVDAPEELLRRAAPAQTDSESERQNPDDEEASEEDTEKAPARPHAGKTAGYRVQVYADNNARSAKTEARQRERALSQAFPAYGTYVSYASPYWRLRVGDFRSTYEAEKAAAEIRRAFPRYAKEVRVVRDYVIIR